MIAPSLRTGSILMLQAGLSLGVFAGTLMADDPDPVSGISRVEEDVNIKVKAYQDYYGLNEVEADEVRQVLTWYGRRLRDRIRTLWQENQGDFDSLQFEADRRIQEVLKQAGKVEAEDDNNK